MRWLMLVALMFTLGCAAEVQRLAVETAELDRTVNDQKELIIQLKGERQTAVEALDNANRDIQECLDEIARLTNTEKSVTTKTVTKVVPTVETKVIEVPKVVPDGSLTATEEQVQYQEILRVQEELDGARTRASELQQQIEAAQVLIDQYGDPTNRYGWPALISAVLTILGFVTGRKWRKQ